MPDLENMIESDMLEKPVFDFLLKGSV